MLLMASFFFGYSGVTSANQFDYTKLTSEQIRSALEVKIRTVQHMALNPVIVDAVKGQNKEKLKRTVITTRDKAWKKSSKSDPFKKSLQTSHAGQFLNRKIKERKEFSEAVLADNQGASVATFSAKPGYDQASQESWRSSFNGGDGTIYISPPGRDKRSGSQSVQISAPVKDKGSTIGVLVVDVTLDYLSEQMKLKK